MFKKIM